MSRSRPSRRLGAQPPAAAAAACRCCRRYAPSQLASLLLIVPILLSRPDPQIYFLTQPKSKPSNMPNEHVAEAAARAVKVRRSPSSAA